MSYSGGSKVGDRGDPQTRKEKKKEKEEKRREQKKIGKPTRVLFPSTAPTQWGNVLVTICINCMYISLWLESGFALKFAPPQKSTWIRSG